MHAFSIESSDIVKIVTIVNIAMLRLKLIKV